MISRRTAGDVLLDCLGCSRLRLVRPFGRRRATSHERGQVDVAGDAQAGGVHAQMAEGHVAAVHRELRQRELLHLELEWLASRDGPVDEDQADVGELQAVHAHRPGIFGAGVVRLGLDLGRRPWSGPEDRHQVAVGRPGEKSLRCDDRDVLEADFAPQQRQPAQVRRQALDAEMGLLVGVWLGRLLTGKDRPDRQLLDPQVAREQPEVDVRDAHDPAEVPGAARLDQPRQREGQGGAYDDGDDQQRTGDESPTASGQPAQTGMRVSCGGGQPTFRASVPKEAPRASCSFLTQKRGRYSFDLSSRRSQSA